MARRRVTAKQRAASRRNLMKARRKRRYGSSPYHRAYATGQFHSKKKARKKRAITYGVSAVGAAAAIGMAGGSVALATHDMRKARKATRGTRIRSK